MAARGNGRLPRAVTQLQDFNHAPRNRQPSARRQQSGRAASAVHAGMRGQPGVAPAEVQNAEEQRQRGGRSLAPQQPQAAPEQLNNNNNNDGDADGDSDPQEQLADIIQQQVLQQTTQFSEQIRLLQEQLKASTEIATAAAAAAAAVRGANNNSSSHAAIAVPRERITPFDFAQNLIKQAGLSVQTKIILSTKFTGGAENFDAWTENIMNAIPSVASELYLELKLDELIHLVTNLQSPHDSAEDINIIRNQIGNILKKNARMLVGQLMNCLEDDDPVRVQTNRLVSENASNRNDLFGLWKRLAEYYRPKRGAESVPLKVKLNNYSSGLSPFTGNLKVHVNGINKLCQRIKLATGEEVRDSDKYVALTTSIDINKYPQYAPALLILSNSQAPTFDAAVEQLLKADTFILNNRVGAGATGANEMSNTGRTERANYAFQPNQSNMSRKRKFNHMQHHAKANNNNRNNAIGGGGNKFCTKCNNGGHTTEEHYDCTKCNRSHHPNVVCTGPPQKQQRTSGSINRQYRGKGRFRNKRWVNNNNRGQQQSIPYNQTGPASTSVPSGAHSFITVVTEITQSTNSNNCQQSHGTNAPCAMHADSSNSVWNPRVFVADSGTNRHILSSVELAHHVGDVRHPYNLTGHDGRTSVAVITKCSVTISPLLELKDVAVLPKPAINLISLSLLQCGGAKFSFGDNGNQYWLAVLVNNQEVIRFEMVNGLYIYTMPQEVYNKYVEQIRIYNSHANNKQLPAIAAPAVANNGIGGVLKRKMSQEDIKRDNHEQSSANNADNNSNENRAMPKQARSQKGNTGTTVNFHGHH
jgi:hypothetical protein